MWGRNIQYFMIWYIFYLTGQVTINDHYTKVKLDYNIIKKIITKFNTYFPSVHLLNGVIRLPFVLTPMGKILQTSTIQ